MYNFSFRITCEEYFANHRHRDLNKRFNLFNETAFYQYILVVFVQRHCLCLLTVSQGSSLQADLSMVTCSSCHAGTMWHIELWIVDMSINIYCCLQCYLCT